MIYVKSENQRIDATIDFIKKALKNWIEKSETAIMRKPLMGIWFFHQDAIPMKRECLKLKSESLKSYWIYFPEKFHSL